MSIILAKEREKYEAVWGQIDTYGEYAPGEEFVDLFLEMGRVGISDLSLTDCRTSVLDAGCGSGKGALALKARGFKYITLCDLTDSGLIPEARYLPFVSACLWDDLRRSFGRFDWVYCCDVLEHIPPQFAMLVVHRLLDVARQGVFLSIGLVQDNFGVWVGEPLHQNVQTFTAWRDQLSAIATVKESRDLLTHGLYLLKPKTHG